MKEAPEPWAEAFVRALCDRVGEPLIAPSTQTLRRLAAAVEALAEEGYIDEPATGGRAGALHWQKMRAFLGREGGTREEAATLQREATGLIPWVSPVWVVWAFGLRRKGLSGPC